MKNATDKSLETILSGLEAAALSQPCLFDRIRGEHAPVILYGAGHTGRELALRMREDYGDRLFFADRRPDLWGGQVGGLPVLSPAEAARRHGRDGVFVITVFNREPDCAYAAIVGELGRLGAARCVPWALAAWKYADALLPRYFLGSAKDILPFREEIRRVFAALADARSRAVFLELLEASLTAPFDRLSAWETGPQYFIPEVLQRLPERCRMVDCGAYDGDTLRDALACLGAERIGEYHAFEPDRENFARLQAFVAGLPVDVRARISCYQAAVGEKEGFVAMNSEGTEASFVATGVAGDIPCMTLDSVLAGRHCDFLKMDIEGSEKDALRGASAVLAKRERERESILAISVYHRPDDFFAIPLCIKALRGGHGLFRKHCANLFDTVYYHFQAGF